MTNEQKRMRAAIYVLHSSNEAQLGGCGDEVNTLREYCAEKGITIAGEYNDREIAGNETIERHELQRMLEDSESGAFDEVVVWKVSHLSQKAKDLLDIIDRLSKGKACLRSYTENFETGSALGMMQFLTLAVYVELEASVGPQAAREKILKLAATYRLAS